MSFVDNLTARLPFFQKSPELEYFFALNVHPENITCAIWVLDGNKLKIINVVEEKYTTEEDILNTTDRLLDQVLVTYSFEPSKILFGVPDSWLQDEDLKETYLKLLRKLVKELELTPLAYVSTSHAITHFLEKQEGSPQTAILVGIGDRYVTVAVTKASKVEGVKIERRNTNIAADIERALLTFNNIEVLPSRILVYGNIPETLAKYKTTLLSYPWMNKLSFLHLPRVEILTANIEIKAVTLAGAVELNSNVRYDNSSDSAFSELNSREKKDPLLMNAEEVHPTVQSAEKEHKVVDEVDRTAEINDQEKDTVDKLPKETLGFIAGDVTERSEEDDQGGLLSDSLILPNDSADAGEFSEPLEDDFVRHAPMQTDISPNQSLSTNAMNEKKKLVKMFNPFGKSRWVILGLIVMILGAGGAYLFLPQAQVVVYIEPRILEKDTEITADPTVREINEQSKLIPGEIVETQVSGIETGQATGKKQIGDPAKGVMVVYNKTDSPKTFNKGTILSASGGLQFSLDTSVTIASQSASTEGISFGKAKVEVTAEDIGPDGNLPSGTDLTIAGSPSSQFAAKTEGNLSGGTSKEVTVVTDADQKKLLAALTNNLKQKARDELQSKLVDKKVLEEALSEEIVKRTYSKNINDQANEFSLNLTVKLKGTAFNENDLKTIVAKLVETNVPKDFLLNIADAETRADVSRVDKDGKVIFLARFRAKLLPKIETDVLRQQIRGKTPYQAAEILKGYENVLGSDIKINPPLPAQLQRLPFLQQNIKIQVSEK